MADSSILIVDDDTELVELVTEYLRREGLSVEAAYNGEKGVERALSGEHSLVVLDVMLPGIGGFEVLRRVRAAPGAIARVPIVILTARGEEIDRVMGLEFGADDYLPKPFSPRELVARIRAVLRRTQSESEAPATSATDSAASASVEPGAPSSSPRPPVRVGDIESDPSTRVVRRDGEPVDLTAVEFDLLDVLLRHAGEVVTRDTIAQHVLERRLLPYDRSIDVHISNLRRKLGPAPPGSGTGGERIKTIRGIGYIYVRF